MSLIISETRLITRRHSSIFKGWASGCHGTILAKALRPGFFLMFVWSGSFEELQSFCFKYLNIEPADCSITANDRAKTIKTNSLILNCYKTRTIQVQGSDCQNVKLYIRNSIPYEIIQTLDKNLELLCVKVIKPKAKPFIVGTSYRPPGSTNEIMQAFESALEKLEQHDLETNILGNFNCDIAAIPLDHQTKKFLDVCNLLQFHQLIQSPTRITANTATTN